MNEISKEEIIEILEGLVGGRALNQDEMGGCVYCGGSGKKGTCSGYGYCNEDEDCHQSDCEWIAGRKLLESLRKS